MKTLTETIKEIKNSSMSYSRKREEVLKLGIMPNEVVLVLGKRPMATTHREVFKFTFGVEVEMCDLRKDETYAMARACGLSFENQGYNHVDSNSIYKFVRDGSLDGNNPTEFVSPVLASGNGFENLKSALHIINSCGGKVNSSCGLHVHIGCTGMTDEWYSNVFNNYMYLEGVIDTFMAKSRRGNDCRWAHSLKNKGLEHCHTINEVRRALNSNRYHKVNCEAWSRHHTIEFRQHSGSTDFEKISNWAKFVGKLVGWSKTHRLSADVNSIDDIAFLTAAEKRFFKGRAEVLSGRAAA